MRQNNKVYYKKKRTIWSNIIMGECQSIMSLLRYTQVVIRIKDPRICCIALGSWGQVCIFVCKTLRKGIDLWGHFLTQWPWCQCFFGLCFGTEMCFLMEELWYHNFVQVFSYTIMDKVCGALDVVLVAVLTRDFIDSDEK